jgi:hypothetical protein
MRRIVLSVVACCAVIAIVPASALAHGRHHSRHHARVHLRTFGHDWSQSSNSGTGTSSDQNAGTVTSFTGGVLTITLNSGQTVSGTVTGDTEIECEAADMSSSLRSHDEGPGGGGNGDDQGDNGNDQGDDDQGQGDDNNQNASCSSTDLTPGTVVHEARLSLSGAGATWDKVELVTTSTSAGNNGDDDNDGD